MIDNDALIVTTVGRSGTARLRPAAWPHKPQWTASMTCGRTSVVGLSQSWNTEGRGSGSAGRSSCAGSCRARRDRHSQGPLIAGMFRLFPAQARATTIEGTGEPGTSGEGPGGGYDDDDVDEDCGVP